VDTRADAVTPRAAAIRFFVLLGVYLVGGVLLLDAQWFVEWFVGPWTRFNASASAALATALGVESTAYGTIVRCGSQTLNILAGCNGAHALLILVASILAFPASWSRRWIGVALGIPLLLGFNLVRLVNLIVVATHWPERLELFHVYIWQTLIILIAFGLFVLWGNFLAQAPAGGGTSDPA